MEIAVSMGAIVKQQEFLGYIQQKNAALKFANNNYVLCLDADEALDDELVNSIMQAKRNFTAPAYCFNRCTNYAGILQNMAAGTQIKKPACLITFCTMGWYKPP